MDNNNESTEKTDETKEIESLSSEFPSWQYDNLEDHIQCMICYEPMKRSVLTRCGHRYCYACLSRSLDKSPYCPSCRRQLDMDEFFDDYQFNSLVEKLLSQRDGIDKKPPTTFAKQPKPEVQEESERELKLQDFFDVFIRKEYLLIFALGYTNWFFSLSVLLMTYASINAMMTKGQSVDIKFLRIWTVYGVFRTYLVLADHLMYWIPFYWGAKSICQTIFLALCFVPLSWNGTRLVYDKVVKPCLLRPSNQFAIDNATKKARHVIRGVVNAAASQPCDLKGGDVVAACIYYILAGFFAQFLTCIAGFACPAYMAFKAIESKKVENQTRAHIYCVVFNVLVLVGGIADQCLFWIPFYWQLKLVVLLGCTVPDVWNGTFLYHRAILKGFRFVKKCQDGLVPHLQSLSRAGRQRVE